MLESQHVQRFPASPTNPDPSLFEELSLQLSPLSPSLTRLWRRKSSGVSTGTLSLLVGPYCAKDLDWIVTTDTAKFMAPRGFRARHRRYVRSDTC